jgi:hypothetical protein
MILNNIFDFVNQDNPKGSKFWIPDCDPKIPFPYSIGMNEVIFDSNGTPAIFTMWMLDSLDWDLWNEVSDGISMESDAQKIPKVQKVQARKKN